MDRCTKSQVELMASRYTAATNRHGVDTSNYILVTGSKTYGNAWRIMERDPQTGGQSEPFAISGGYLGMTAREAWETLATVSFALERASELVRAND